MYVHILEFRKEGITMKSKINRLLGIVGVLMLFGPAALSAECKCKKPPKDKLEEAVNDWTPNAEAISIRSR